MTYRLTASRRIIPCPMVLATAVPNVKAATKLKNAAQMTATRGDSTLVETTVAMELAASWKPFKKSKVRATKMRKTANQNIFLRVKELPQSPFGGSRARTITDSD